MEAYSFYHIYNRGNNRQPIFFKRDNYLFFLNKARTYFLKNVDVLAYCLMPNHFHFLVYTHGDFNQLEFSHDLRIMLSSYTRAINKQEQRVGSLFQQNTKVKLLESRSTTQSGATTNETGDPFICFHYIHQNPAKANLVTREQEWEFSSYRDYAGLRSGTLCNKSIANQLLDIPLSSNEFIKQSNLVSQH